MRAMAGAPAWPSGDRKNVKDSERPGQIANAGVWDLYRGENG
jgi:hypothetical protein